MPAGRRAWVWTETRRRSVQADVRPGRTAAELARMHGLSERAVEHAFDRGYLTKANENPIERKCLCCGRVFLTDTPYIRSCDACRDRGSPLADAYLSAGT